jgi:hypothetical protein
MCVININLNITNGTPVKSTVEYQYKLTSTGTWGATKFTTVADPKTEDIATFGDYNLQVRVQSSEAGENWSAWAPHNFNVSADCDPVPLDCHTYTITGNVPGSTDGTIIGNYQVCGDGSSAGFNVIEGGSTTFCSRNVPQITTSNCPSGVCITQDGSCTEGTSLFTSSGGSGISNCAGAGVAVFNTERWMNKSVISLGTIVYLDLGLTNALNGGNNWYHLSATYSIRINTFGVITETSQC